MLFQQEILKLIVDLYASAARLNKKKLSLKKQYLAVNLRNYIEDFDAINALLAQLDTELNMSFTNEDIVGAGIEFPVADSVRLVRLSQKINQQTSYWQKLVVMQLIIEQFRIGDITSNQRNEALEAISSVFNLRLNDFQQIKYFCYIDLSEKDFDEHTVVVSAASLNRQEALQEKRHILISGMQGYIMFKNIAGLILFKYLGGQANYFFNGTILEKGRAYQLTNYGQLLIENTTLNAELIKDQLFRTFRFNDLLLKPTNKTPEVELNRDKHTLTINGRLYPENPFSFFDTINAWIDYYLSVNPPKLDIHINITYYNTTSSKLLLNLLKKILSFGSEAFEISITWKYDKDDEEMMRTISNYATLLDFPIRAEEIDD
ncbi:MAG: SiaC family regulatory phosphoprotein [Sediminibacterium sp.]|nr:SiaC family regulatory phosphoprotein [Sediminibacterium sp.]